MTTDQSNCTTLACMQDSVADWLKKEMADRGLKPAELARAMGNKDEGSVSRILSGERKVGPDLAKALARALQLPQTTVFRAAGLLDEVDPNQPTLTERIWEAVNLLNSMGEQDQEDEIATLRLRAQRRKRGSDNDKRATSGADR